MIIYIRISAGAKRRSCGMTGKSGSALLLTLLVVSLLLVLVLSFATYVRMELRSVSLRQQQEIARANARLGLSLAMARLQEAVGVDTRVTVRGDFQDPAVNQPLWTGGWASRNPDPAANPHLDMGTSPSLREWSMSRGGDWLVSREQNVDPDPGFTGALSGASRNAVELDSVYRLRVPVVALRDSDGNRTGEYAFWVGDEGVKARVNLQNDSAREVPTEPLHYAAPATVAGEQVVNPAYRDSYPIDPATDMTRLASTESFPLIMPAAFREEEAGWDSARKDLTLWSRSVLTDVKRGGLKLDLTAAFENVDQFNELTRGRDGPGYLTEGRQWNVNELNIRGKLWRVGTPNVLSRDGRRWFPFYHYYNLYKAEMPPPWSGAGLPAYPGTGDRPRGLGGLQGDEVEPRWIENQNTHIGEILPMIAGYKAQIGISSFVKGDGTYGLRFHYLPQLLLWNPYDAVLTGRGDPEEDPLVRIVYHLEHNAFSVGDDHKVVIRKTSGEREIIYDGTLYPDENPWWHVYQPRWQDTEFQPGQIRIFGLGEDVDLGSLTPEEFQAYRLVGGDQVGDGFSFYSEVPITASLPLDADDTINVAYMRRVRANVQHHEVGGSRGALGGGVYTEKTRYMGSQIPAYQAGGSNRLYSIFHPRWRTPDTMVGGLDMERLEEMQPIAAFIKRLPGRFPSPVYNASGELDEDVARVKAPMQGGPGRGYNPFDLNGPLLASRADNRVGTGFTSAEELFNDGFGSSSFGEEDAGLGAQANPTVLYELPRRPLVSLMQLRNTRTRFHGSLYPLGDSMPHPFLHLNQLYRDDLSALDDIWLNNDALFDGFFFSGIPPETLPPGTQLPDPWTTFTLQGFQAGEPLLNPRLRFHANASTPTIDAGDLRNMDTVAAHLMMEGGFNINSTSVPAWRAVLSSLRFSGDPSRIPVVRSIHQQEGPPSDPADYQEAHQRGIRTLTPDQVQSLAEAVVDQVRLRGPFLTLADFVNRRMDPGTLGEAGALQAAIDVSGINEAALLELGEDSDPTPANLQPSTASGAKGVVTQGDLLMALAPIMSARSDTFVIRTYGAVGTGDSLATRTWLEAVVQRVPDYVDESNQPWERGTELSPVNARFGRQFKVVHLKWLNEDDI